MWVLKANYGLAVEKPFLLPTAKADDAPLLSPKTGTIQWTYKQAHAISLENNVSVTKQYACNATLHKANHKKGVKET